MDPRFISLLAPDPIWRWDHFTSRYDELPLGGGQWHMIQDKLVITAQNLIKDIFNYDEIQIIVPKKKKLKPEEENRRQGFLEKEGLYSKYTFEVPFGEYLHKFIVRNIPVSHDTKQINILFKAVLSYLSSAYFSIQSNLERHELGHLLASHDLMRIADAFILNFSKTVLLEYLYYIFNIQKSPISENAYVFKDHSRYNLELLDKVYKFGIELSTRKIENKEISTGFIFHETEEQLSENSVKRIELAEKIEFGNFRAIKSLIKATNGKNIFFNVIDGKITHIFTTRGSIQEIAMEPFGEGKTFGSEPLILSIQGTGKVVFLQGNTDRNRILLQLIHSQPLIKDYRFIENYINGFLKDNLSDNIDPTLFVKWLMKLPTEKRGATIIIGDFEKENIRKSLVSFSEVSATGNSLFNLVEIEEKLLDHLTMPDGALIFNNHGELLFIGSILPFSKGKKVLGGGARHQSAINFSKQKKCIGITISEDGGISIFDTGKSLIKF